MLMFLREDVDSVMRILHNMALENERPWWAFWRPRFTINHEPLRHDAANLLRRIGYEAPRPIGTKLVGD